MLTFAQIKRDPTLLTAEIRSPIVHPEGMVTALWQGGDDTEEETSAGIFCQVAWLDELRALERIPGTPIWGADLPCPPLPATVCSTIQIGSRNRSIPSPLHDEALTGPLTPPLPTYLCAPSPMVTDETLSAENLSASSRRIRVFAPTEEVAPRHALLVLDGQTFAGPGADLPVALDDLRRMGEAPPSIVVAVDGAPGAARQSVFLMDGAHNAAARQWFAEAVHPTISERFGVARWTVVGWSNSASLALQLALERPDLFAGCAAFSPWSRGGGAALQALAEQWPGSGRIWLSHGDFGLGETRNLPVTQTLAATLARRGANVHYHEARGYGHCYGAWSRLLPHALRWLHAM